MPSARLANDRTIDYNTSLLPGYICGVRFLRLAF